MKIMMNKDKIGRFFTDYFKIAQRNRREITTLTPSKSTNSNS